MCSIKKFKAGILHFGYMAMLMIFEDALKVEDYELCQKIETALKELEREYQIEYPREVNDETMYDYETKFWVFGMSGETAVRNIDHYKDELIKYLEKQ